MYSVFQYIFPNRCVNCTRIIPEKQMPLCMICYAQMSFTHWPLNDENPAFDLLQKHVAIKNASSLLAYQFGNVTQKLIVANKYYNRPNIGLFLAELAVPTLQNHDFDVLTCIPSHPRTLRQRGYNQVMSFAKRLSTLLELKFSPELLKRIKRRDSQVYRNWNERHASLENAFEVTDEIQHYNNILLVDDVLTSGATVSNCCKAIYAKKQLEISVFTMAKTS